MLFSRSLKAEHFVSKLDVLEKDFLEVDPCPPPSALLRTLAVRILMQGFARVADRDGLTSEEAAEMGFSSWEKVLLTRALKKVPVASLRQPASWAEGVLNPAEVEQLVDASK